MIKKTTITVAVLVCIVAIWIYAEKENAQAVRPPASGTNLVSFLEERSEVSSVRKFNYNGKLHVEVIGKPHASALSVPSGPPAYIFDENGAFVDWCGDIGDNPSFIKKWGDFNDATVISPTEAKQLVRMKQ